MSASKSVKPSLGSVQWQGGQDFCPDTLCLESVPVPSREAAGEWRIMETGAAKCG